MKRITTFLLAGAFLLTACDSEDPPVAPETSGFTSTSATAHAQDEQIAFVMDPERLAEIEAGLGEYVLQQAAEIQARRAEAGVALPAGVGVAAMGFSWTGELEGQTLGREVYFSNRGNKQLPIQWVPGDPRRGGRTDVGYAIDDLGLVGNYAEDDVGADQAIAAIDRAMATWDGQSCSSGLTVPRGDFFEWLTFQSDVFHLGFSTLPVGVLGVTSSFVFVDNQTRQPTDIDADGNLDYAFAVITYNTLYRWGIDDPRAVDIETVALHEMGHGLGQAHFGEAFLTPSNGTLHFSPRAVMNAAYSGIQQDLGETDLGGHCSMYGSWPNS